jgi:NAD(P)-dependent dehydrogenase (short-subunit alcohol dehydrogenase family)
MSQGKLHGKVAIITGGGGGFGKGIAAEFKKQGGEVIIAESRRDQEGRLGGAGQVRGREVWAFGRCREQCWDDVSQQGTSKAIRRRYWGVELCWMLELTCTQPTNEVTDEDFDKVFTVNVRSIYYSANVIVPYMQKKGNGGSFINIASTAGLRPRGGLTWYNASKAAVINASKSMAVEYAKDNIRFNSVCPVVGMGTGL